MLGSRRRGAGGFTLVELLIALGVLGVIMGALAVISVLAIRTYSDDSRSRVLDATAARLISRQFAKDVQGAQSGATPGTCNTSIAGATPLVTLTQSSDSSTVGWLYKSGVLYRSAKCDGSAPKIVARGLTTATVAPANSSTTNVSLTVARGTAPKPVFSATMDGRTRLQTMPTHPGAPPTTIPQDTPQFLSLTGSTPLRISGNADLHVVGNAYINQGTGGAAIDINGNQKKLYVSGKLGIQSGSTCGSCSASTIDGYNAGANTGGTLPNATSCTAGGATTPCKFSGFIPDPYGFLPAPAPGSTQTTCPKSGSVRICSPGVYQTAFPPDGNGTYQLQPGVYTLRNGISVKSTNNTLTGSGVLIYNEVGDIAINGGAFDLHPPTSGIYQGVLLFQARSNKDPISVQGNASVSTLEGIIYAPASTDVSLSGGGGTLRVGAVVGQSLSIFGNGHVYVNGS